MGGEALAAGAAGLPLQSQVISEFQDFIQVKLGDFSRLDSIFEIPGARLCRHA